MLRFLFRAAACLSCGLLAVLAGDPRPRYQNDPARVYGLTYSGRNVKFTVSGEVLTVTEIL